MEPVWSDATVCEPSGWFRITRSDTLAAGQHIQLRRFGRNLMVSRHANGGVGVCAPEGPTFAADFDVSNDPQWSTQEVCGQIFAAAPGRPVAAIDGADWGSDCWNEPDVVEWKIHSPRRSGLAQACGLSEECGFLKSALEQTIEGLSGDRELDLRVHGPGFLDARIVVRSLLLRTFIAVTPIDSRCAELSLATVLRKTDEPSRDIMLRARLGRSLRAMVQQTLFGRYVSWSASTPFCATRH